MNLPHCAVFKRDTISYVIMLPEDLPPDGMPIVMRTNIVEREGVLVLDFIDRPGNGVSVDKAAERDMMDSMRIFIFIADEASRGIVAEIIPTWDGRPHSPKLDF